MRIIHYWLGFALLFPLSATASLTDPAAPIRTATFQTHAYASPDATKLRVVVVKPEGQRVYIRLTDQRGEAVASHTVLKAEQTAHARFDLTDLPEGTYRLHVWDNETRTEQRVQVTAPATPTRQLTVARH